MKKRILSLILCIAMCMGVLGAFVGCGDNENPTPGADSSLPSNKDALVIMSEELDGLFNPFYSTSGADSTIVSMTQIGMLTSKYVDGKVQVAYGDNEAVVAKDYMSKHDPATDTTTYTFVLKNGIKYSDGQPLTMEDVLFNLYVYLDPVYAGSATLYSTKIKGLNAYRLQKETSDDGSSADNDLSEQASTRAMARINELVNRFYDVGKPDSGDAYYADVQMMKDAINALTEDGISDGYKEAIAVDLSSKTHEEWKAQLLADYDKICKLYREELEKAFDTALEAYTEAPYKDHEQFKNQIFCFMASQGYVEIKFANNGKDKSKIESLKAMYNEKYSTKEEAVKYAFDDTIAKDLPGVLMYTASAQTVINEYVSNAKDVILHELVGEDGSLTIESIEGIVSLGHNSATKGTTVAIENDKGEVVAEYKVATEHNADGTVKNKDEYDVLQITIDGIDPKAVWNFAFAVAPQHVYGKGSKVGVDIADNKFGVEWGSFDFMTKIVQSTQNIKVPVGAGAYKATNRSNGDNPAGNEFYSDNVVYFKANNYFETVGSGLNNAKIEKVRYQVVSATNSLPMLESGNIHYATPQLTDANFTKIEQLQKLGANYILNDQLGYGYIGVNASKIPNLYLRRAIMCAMDTALALDYYRPGTAERIFWPMSTVSWAYPKDGKELNEENGHAYPVPDYDKTEVMTLIKDNMEKAEAIGYSDEDLRVIFTIAGSNLQDHPTYKIFRDAAALLNEMGWQITVQADTQALTKLSTGSLEVWAAAWGSTIDPDMYQVYHKNSTATSTLAWGYPSIKTSGSDEEQEILDLLSEKIEQARETDVESERAELYKQAMSYVLDLAIELPVYQRSVVYVYNSKVIKESSLPEASNPYSSPLDRIWEVEFTD